MSAYRLRCELIQGSFSFRGQRAFVAYMKRFVWLARVHDADCSHGRVREVAVLREARNDMRY